MAPVTQGEIILLGHLSDSGDLLLWVGIRSHPLSIIRCLRPSFDVNIFSRTTGQVLTKFGM